jgi:16S rRNA (uracil1498-N3)-methyltransferase
VGPQLREQAAEPDLWLVFAPVKRARIDFIASKATELGVSRLVPMFTRHTAVERVNVERLRANAVEAAEQCGRLTVPEVADPTTLEDVIAGWAPSRRLLVCDETGAAPPIAEVLSAMTPPESAASGWAVMTGPEGGFAPGELDLLRNSPIVTMVALGPRILRADTAAVAALVCWQALCGDWRQAGRLSGHAKGC